MIELAEKVRRVADAMGISVSINHLDNPRVEKEEHYYNAKNTTLHSLGLSPNLLTDDFISSLLKRIMQAKDRIDHDIIRPSVYWKRRDINI